MRPATLARRIDRLHRHGEPLNIDAVRRRHPDLLEAAYAVRPFLGWRGALERAGVRYEKIRMELVRTVDCKLCGATLQSLGRHLQVVHGTDAVGYRAEYPGADVVAAALRAAITRRDRRTELRALAIVPHWEPIWSPEYVLDRVAHLHRLGHPVNLEWVFEREPTLVRSAAIHHGGWDVVLRKVGLDPEDVRKHRPATHWTRAAALEALRNRRAAGLSLRHADLDRDAPGLSKALSRLFGSGRAALGRVGVRLRKPARYTDGDVQALLTAVRATAGGTGSAHWKALADLRQRFAGIMQQRFRTWGAAARAAGVPPEAILFPHGRTRYRDTEACLAEIGRRRAGGLSLMSAAVQRGGRRRQGALPRGPTLLRHVA